MAVWRCLIILMFLETTRFTEGTSTTRHVNITLRDTNDTSAGRNQSLDFTDLEVSGTPEYFPAAARTPESVTAFPDQTESPESSIPGTSSESPRAATEAPAPRSTDEEGLSSASPEVPTDSLIDGGSNVTSAPRSADVGGSSGYQYGEVIQTVNETEMQDFFSFPSSAGTAHCLDSNPAGFLKDQMSRCMRSFDLVRDCQTLGALRLETYMNFGIRSGKIQEAKVIGVEVAAVTLQSLEGTRTPADPADLASYTPVLLQSADVCNNVVLQVKYTLRYSGAGEILNAMASVLLGAVKSVAVPIQQEFQITFLQDVSSSPVLQLSGNPGYVMGRPLMAGTRTAHGIVQSADPKGSLTILQSSVDQDCLSGSSRRSPVLFGIDTVSGCTLKLSDGVNCSLVSEVILWALKGQSFPDHVASFGNSLPQNPLDWVPIQNQTTALSTQSCSIPLSYHLEVKWTKYGALVNPQAQIVSVTETVITNTSSLVLLTSASGLLSVTSSVSFIDVSASASPGFKAPPTIDAKLPFDFFFPFV